MLTNDSSQGELKVTVAFGDRAERQSLPWCEPVTRWHHGKGRVELQINSMIGFGEWK